jgi:hypothetical protein
LVLIAALIAIEKLLPWERCSIGASAVVLVLLGAAVVLFPDQVPGIDGERRRDHE